MKEKIEDAGSYITATTAVTRVRGGGYGNGAWIARITGTDKKWGLARAFCRRDTSGLSGSGKSGSIRFVMDGDGIYEFRQFCIGSTSRNWEWSGFVQVENGLVCEISKADVIKITKEMEGLNGA